MNQIKVLMLALCLCVAGTVSAAAPLFLVDGSTSFEQDRVIHFERSLNFSKEPMVSVWSLTILPDDVFQQYVKDHNIPTETAYTYAGVNHTYLNEDVLLWQSDEVIRHVIAHEAGHLICECRSEDKANEIAVQLEQ